MRATFCQLSARPPYLELVEATGSGIYSPARGEGLHHIGMWDPQIAVNKRAFSDAKALPADAEILLPDGSLFAWFSDPADAHGVRLEFVHEGSRPHLQRWIDSGVPGRTLHV